MDLRKKGSAHDYLFFLPDSICIFNSYEKFPICILRPLQKFTALADSIFFGLSHRMNDSIYIDHLLSTIYHLQ